MALCHELSAIYTNDTTPYDPILPKQKQDQKKVLSKMLHISQSKKEEIFKKEYNEEKRALEKLTKNLQPKLRAEIIQLWKEYRTRSSPEGNFLNQLNSVIVLLQGIIFKKEYKQISLTPLWEWVYEKCDHPVCLQFLDDLKKIK
jgi:5'-deoxynucleotidase YfbR-like HD superfamily hydrolase